MSVTRLALCAILGASSLLAQINPVSWPQDSTLTGAGNLVPFGFLKSRGTADEGRYQLLIPARYLPSTGGFFLGLGSVTIPGTGAVTYRSLKITMSLTRASTLSSTFKNNLPTPLIVFNKQNVTINWVQRTWTRLGFAVPVPYDGKSNLVIEIQKIVDSSKQTVTLLSNGTSSNPGRRDLPLARYTFGKLNSGSSTATTARFAALALKVRLLFAGDTLTLKSDPGGARRSVFAIGGSLDVRVHGAKGTAFGNLVDTAFGTPTRLSFIGGAAWLRLNRAIFLNGGTIGASGVNTLTLAIPNNPSMVGARFVFQGATLKSGRLAWTCAADLLINM